MPPRGRPVVKGRPSSSAPTGSHIVALGNCRLDVPDALGYELTHEGFSTEIQDVGTLKVYEVVTRIITPPIGLSWTLLNPKNVDCPGKQLLQDVLHLYNVELPAMSFAANTGKESPFLESCIMDGKYCTLIMRNNDPGSAESELIGAVSFQILPPDTQQAEIPLAVVRHAYQRKGYGALMYKELQKRLVDVGVTSVFCWGDIESEAFWSKQGFVKLAEVDGRGKPKKLPIKGDLKKAMSIPGSAALMISYLDCSPFQTTVSVSPESLKARKDTASKVAEKSSSDTPSRANNLHPVNMTSPTTRINTPQLAGEVKSSLVTTPPYTVSKSPELSYGISHKCSSSIIPLNMDGKLFSIAPELSFKTSSPATASEPLEPALNPLQIVPFTAPDSESLDGSDNSASAYPVTDASKSPRPLKKRTYVRRKQDASKSSSAGLLPNSNLSRPSGKENNAGVQLDIDLEKGANEEGKLSSFLGPRAKVGQRKDSAFKTSGASAGHLDPNAEKQDEAEVSPLSAFIGPRKKSVLDPVCGPQVALDGGSVQAPANNFDMNVETGAGSGTLNKSSPTETRPRKRGRPTKSRVSELGESGEEALKNDDVLSPTSASERRAGVKRGTPPKAPTSGGEKNVRGAVVNNQVVLSGSGASEEKEKAVPVKRGRSSTLPVEGANKKAPKSSPVEKDLSNSVQKTGSKGSGKAVKIDGKDLGNKAGGKYPARGRASVSASEAAEPKTGSKRGRPAKLVGTRTKRRKADPPSSNQGSPEADADNVVDVDGDKKDAEDGLADIVNMLLPAQKDAGADTSVQGCTDMKEGTSESNSLDSPLRRDVQVSRRADVPELNNGTNKSLPGAHPDGVSELAPNDGAEDDQESEKPKYVIMFMNMADENKKRQLIKHVETLGGLVTCEGSKCTHVVTMEVRRTLNFCVAISSGAWILSPDWLKVCVKQKRFVDEEPYILRDKKFQAKYNISLQDVIPRARQMPNLLLDGMYIYPTPNVHPPVDTISEIVKAAGGQVLGTFEEALELDKKPLGIVVACEEDMEQAMTAAKAGFRTYNSDWLLTCIVKQDLDFSVPQFTESL